jgi:hypothetical protein
MYCPYCAALLIEAEGGQLLCPKVGAYFSQRICAIFRELCSNTHPDKTPTTLSINNIFCPVCSTKTNNGVCENCNAVLTSSILRQIIELNPHVGT